VLLPLPWGPIPRTPLPVPRGRSSPAASGVSPPGRASAAILAGCACRRGSSCPVVNGCWLFWACP
jgi:hypothetical protein